MRIYLGLEKEEREHHGENQHERNNLEILSSFDLITTTSITQSE